MKQPQQVRALFLRQSEGPAQIEEADIFERHVLSEAASDNTGQRGGRLAQNIIEIDIYGESRCHGCTSSRLQTACVKRVLTVFR